MPFPPRRFPPPWSVRELEQAFVVMDANGQASAGGGKSHLMRVAAIAWCTAIVGLQVYVFRRAVSNPKCNNDGIGTNALFGEPVQRRAVKFWIAPLVVA
jgi:hypothetical protein